MIRLFNGKVFVCCLLFFTMSLPTRAQDPDPLPLPSIPEEVISDSLRALINIDVDSLTNKILGPNVLEFCGSSVDLDRRDRNARLRRELEVMSHYSSVLIARANYYFPRVEPILKANNIPDDFKYLMVVESFMNPNAVSPKGAAGLWQFMPKTAENYGLVVNDRIDERYQTLKATDAACRYLRAAYEKFGDWVAVAQSYNIGQARIEGELARQDVDDAIDLKLVEETNRYVYRILATKIIFTNPTNFGVSNNALYYKRLQQLMHQLVW